MIDDGMAVVIARKLSEFCDYNDCEYCPFGPKCILLKGDPWEWNLEYAEDRLV